MNPISRRHLLRTASLSTAGAALAANLAPNFGLGRLFAQAAAGSMVEQARAAAATTPIEVTKLADNLYLLQGAGGNMALQTGKDGKLLVDSSFSTAAPAILEKIKAAGPGDPKILINTHWHFDHTDGNEALHKAGFAITAHRNTLIRLSAPQTIKLLNLSLPAAPTGARPTTVFDQAQHFSFNGDSVDLAHFDPAHTDTDISIHFTKANVLHCGDTFFNGFYPFIDESTKGSIGGMIDANKAALALAQADTKIIPGHGPLGTKAELQAFHDMLSGIRDKVATLKKSGASEQEVIAKKPTAQWDEKWGKGRFTGDALTGIAYRTV